VGETERESGDRIKVHHQPEKVEEEEEENKTEFQFVAFSVVRLASAIIQFSRFVELTQVSINLPGTTQLRRSSTVVYNPPSTCATIAEKKNLASHRIVYCSASIVIHVPLVGVSV
jgi:hypothetical protein